MIVRYLGHSSFWISSQKSTSIVTDPYGAHIPYNFPPLEADIVVVSHEHRDHNANHRVNGQPALVKRTHDFMCEQEVNVSRTGEAINFHGLPTFHDNFSGRKRGPNTVWHWYCEGLHFCHLGDLGHLLTDQQLSIIGNVDVLFVPVGGLITLTPSEASLVINQLTPKLVFPMHYLTPAIEGKGLAESPLAEFTEKMSSVEDAATMAVDVELARLPSSTKVMVLRHE